MGRTTITKQQIEQVLSLRKEGHTFKKIGEMVGISEVLALRICKRNTKTDKMTPAYQKSLCECYPREIFAYLRHLGYKGELTLTTKQTIKL